MVTEYGRRQYAITVMNFIFIILIPTLGYTL